MSERREFVRSWINGSSGVAELSRTFGISRRTGYKWLARHLVSGDAGLEDRSRAPRRHPNAISPGIAALIIATKHAHPTWGPRKILDWLTWNYLGLELPAVSTAGELLKRHGLVVSKQLRRRAEPYGQPFHGCDAPNQTWCGDFKGHFPLAAGPRCHPLTITDAYSRFLLRCQGFPRESGADVFRCFERTFREFGLPEAIRTDNGAPFASPQSVAGLSRLAVWWIKLGIRPERIDPGRPDQNGRHERMHRTLKQETTKPPKDSIEEQQRVFDRFVRTFNEERPHEALGGKPPAAVYVRSPREMPARVPEIEYPEGVEVKRVSSGGVVHWRNTPIFLGAPLGGESVSIQEVEDGHWLLQFGPKPLGVYDVRKKRVVPFEQKTASASGASKAPSADSAPLLAGSIEGGARVE